MADGGGAGGYPAYKAGVSTCDYCKRIGPAQGNCEGCGAAMKAVLPHQVPSMPDYVMTRLLVENQRRMQVSPINEIQLRGMAELAKGK